MHLFIPYLCLLALIYLALSFNTIRLRYKHRSPIGTKEHPSLEYAARGHANFAEYTPFALILIYACHMTGSPSLLIHILLLMLTIGRACHAYCFGVQHNFTIRRTGMIMTFLSYFVCIIALITNFMTN